MDNILFLEILLVISIALLGYIWRSHDKLHHRLEAQIEKLQATNDEQRDECSSSYASKESVERLWKSHNEEKEKSNALNMRVTLLEKNGR